MERLYYLDYLRAFAMIVGILLHVTTLGDFGWLEVLGPVSHNFRMGTFFAVSGFFAALLLDRRSLRGFLGSRLLALGLAVGLVLLIPLTLWMVHAWRLGPVGPDQLGRIVALSFDPRNGVGANFDWHLHLWFLISLLCYTLAAPLLRPGCPRGWPPWGWPWRWPWRSRCCAGCSRSRSSRLECPGWCWRHWPMRPITCWG